MQRYLQRLAAFQAPTSVDAAENTLRIFAGWMLGAGLDSVAAVRREQIEDFKVWLASKPHPRGGTISPETHRQRLRMVRSFFERIIEWDWPDASARNPVINGDIPKARPVTEVPREPAATRLLAMFGTQDISPQYHLGSAVVPSPKVAPHCRAPKLPLGLPEQFSLRPEAVRCEPSTCLPGCNQSRARADRPGPIEPSPVTRFLLSTRA